MTERSLRLVAIRDLFDEPRWWSCEDIANRVGVSERTIQRDLLDLQTEPFYLPLVKMGNRYKHMEGMDVGLTVADLLRRGLCLDALDDPPQQTPSCTTCAITGVPIAAGYPVADMVTGATAEFLDCFRGNPTGWVSETVAICFKSYRETSQQLMIFEDGTCYNPLISVESAHKQGRACWSELVREVWPVRRRERVLILLTTNMRKRLWPAARVGALGNKTPVLLYDDDMDCVAFIDWRAMLDCLDLVENVYTMGFPKEAIRHGLYLAHNVMLDVGVQQTVALDTALRHWRDKGEFDMALLIAQKGE